MASRFILPFADVGSGITPSSGAQLFFFATGTSTPKDTFSDATALIENSNPVDANSKGVFPNIFIEGNYKVVLKDKKGSQIWTADPVVSTGASGGTIGKFTLADAVANTAAQEGQIVQITDRADGQFTYTTGQSPNTFNIVQCTGVPTLALVLRVEYPINVLTFGVLSDGSDTSAATQAVADFIAADGGAVEFPTPGIYGYASQVNWTSDHAISIKSAMGADNTSSAKGYIKPLSGITGSIFNMSCRGGTVSGLWFRDATGVIGVSQGTIALDAALKLSVFGMGKVEKVYFDQILGAGIEVDNMIRGNLSKIHMRDCGTPTQPAFWLNSATPLIPGQVTITDCHFETCYGDYVNVGVNAHNTKIDDCHFESDDQNSDTHNTYIANDGGFTLIGTSSFNQQGGKYVILNGARTQIDNCQFLGLSGALSLARIELNSSFNAISNCIFNGTSADVGTTIDDIVGNNSFSNIIINAGG